MTDTDIYLKCTNKNTDHPSKTIFPAFNFHFVDRIFLKLCSKQRSVICTKTKNSSSSYNSTNRYLFHPQHIRERDPLSLDSCLPMTKVKKNSWKNWNVEKSQRKTFQHALVLVLCTVQCSLLLLFVPNSTFSWEIAICNR